ncbi:MAG: hypothetical protein JWO33_2711 [Caulobacteraceae bacterium]|nr:hypothetical protein [Caulobacteraceae bacterium]
MTVLETPVLIVGGGPAGLALAIDLAYHGQRSTLVEADAGTALVLLAKAGGLNARTLEFCRRWGFADRVHDCGLPPDYPRDTVHVTALDGHFIVRDPLPSARDRPPTPGSPEVFAKCPQHIFDPLLAEKAQASGLADIRYGHRLESFTQDPEGVTAQVTALATGEAVTIRVRYMVGCDGSASQVRKELGIPFEGKTLGFSVSAMLRIDRLEQHHDWGRAERFMFIGPHGAWANMTSMDYQQLWRFTLMGTMDKASSDSLDVLGEVRRGLGPDIPFEHVRTMPWRRSESTARTFRSGRVLLAGDAAHTTSPTGGHGLNTSLGDVVGLGWALDAVLRGWGGEGLLDAYAHERRPVAMRNSAASTRNYLNWVGGCDYSRVLEETPAGQAARDAVGEHMLKMLYVEWHSLGIGLGYRYEGSPAIVDDGTPETPDETSVYVQTAKPGHRAPHAWLADGRSTIDLFGHGLVLLRFGGEDLDLGPFRTAAAARGIPLSVVDIADPAIAGLYERRLVLVRPDGHVGWRSDAPPADPDQVLRVVAGLRPPPRARQDEVDTGSPARTRRV